MTHSYIVEPLIMSFINSGILSYSLHNRYSKTSINPPRSNQPLNSDQVTHPQLITPHKLEETNP